MAEEESKKSAGGVGGLFSSAKLVGEAAQAACHGEVEKIDKPKAAGAAGDLLGAASDYGHLKEKGYGQYVEKAEGYLRQYAAPAGSAAETATATATEAPPKAEEVEQKAESGGSQPEGAAGDVLKKAEGLFKF